MYLEKQWKIFERESRYKIDQQEKAEKLAAKPNFNHVKIFFIFYMQFLRKDIPCV